MLRRKRKLRTLKSDLILVVRFLDHIRSEETRGLPMPERQEIANCCYSAERFIYNALHYVKELEADDK